jgi:hypothetical protein
MSDGLADDGAEKRRLEALAEAAYDAMYDAQPRAAKDHYDDARGFLSQAIDAAKRAGLHDEVARLTKRQEHITSVWASQFRGVGY